jgi:hypothetical protein
LSQLVESHLVEGCVGQASGFAGLTR